MGNYSKLSFQPELVVRRHKEKFESNETIYNLLGKCNKLRQTSRVTPP